MSKFVVFPALVPRLNPVHTDTRPIFRNQGRIFFIVVGNGEILEKPSADYVYRETKRALASVAGTRTQIWPGIDIDIPTEANNSKSPPQRVKSAVTAPCRQEPGVLLSRKCSEMRLANLSGAGDAIRELKS